MDRARLIGAQFFSMALEMKGDCNALSSINNRDMSGAVDDLSADGAIPAQGAAVKQPGRLPTLYKQ